MTGFVVLSTGLQGRVRAAGSALEHGVDLGVFEALSGRVVPAGTRRREVRALAEKLAAVLGKRAAGTVVGLVVPDPGDPDVLTAVAEVLESHGMVPGILAPRTALAREALRRANRTVGAVTWLLDVSPAGFTVFSLDGAKQIAVRQDLEQLAEYRRTVVAAAFKAEHKVDIKQVGGTPGRVDAWLEELQRSGSLESEQHVEWRATEGTALPLRSHALAKALENVHGSAVLAMENACLEALTEQRGAIVVSGSVDAWFHVGPRLRAALPDTYVHILEEDEEAVLIEGLWDRMGAPGAGKVWLLAAGGDAPSDSLEWESLPPVGAEAEAEAEALAQTATPRAAAPASQPAAVVAVPDPRSRRALYAGMAVLAAAQVLTLLGIYARGTDGNEALRQELEVAEADREELRAALVAATARGDELATELELARGETERLAFAVTEVSGEPSTRVEETLSGLRDDVAEVRALQEAQAEELAASGRRVAAMEVGVGALAGVSVADRLGEMQTTSSGLDARMAELQRTVEGLDARVARVDEHEAALASLTEAVAAGGAAATAVDAAALTALVDRVERNESTLQQLSGNIQESVDGSRIESLLYRDLSSQRMRVFNEAQSRIARIGEDSEGHGSMKLYNDVGEYSVLLGSGEGGDAGFVGTYGRDGQELFVATSQTSTGAAHVSLHNSDGDRRIAMTTNSNDDAVLWLFNREGKVVEVLGGGGDLAEAVRPAPGAELRPGMVVRAVGADADGPLVVPADSAADPRVLGILSGANDLLPAMTLNRTRAPDEQAVALAGQVYCLVDATDAPVQPGDLLVSAARPGHARRADPAGAPQGAVLGKAVEGLDTGTGLIRVWIGPR